MEKTDIAERICKKTRLGWDEGYDRFTQLTGIGKSNNELFIGRTVEIGMLLHRREHILKLLGRSGIIERRTRDEIVKILTGKQVNLKILELIDWVKLQLAPPWPYSPRPWYIDHEHRKTIGEGSGSPVFRVLCNFEKELRGEQEKMRKTIADRQIREETYVQDAERYEERFKQWIDHEKTHEGREKLPEAARRWALAGELDRAIEYFDLCSPYEYPQAAEFFEEIGNEELAKRFWIRAAEHPTGYREELDCRAGEYYEKAGDLRRAIGKYEDAMAYWRWQDGSCTLAGDPKMGASEADSLEKYVDTLKKKLRETDLKIGPAS